MYEYVFRYPSEHKNQIFNYKLKTILSDIIIKLFKITEFYKSINRKNYMKWIIIIKNVDNLSEGGKGGGVWKYLTTWTHHAPRLPKPPPFTCTAVRHYYFIKNSFKYFVCFQLFNLIILIISIMYINFLLTVRYSGGGVIFSHRFACIFCNWHIFLPVGFVFYQQQLFIFSTYNKVHSSH